MPFATMPDQVEVGETVRHVSRLSVQDVEAIDIPAAVPVAVDSGTSLVCALICTTEGVFEARGDHVGLGYL